jgi:hypothetical protein
MNKRITDTRKTYTSRSMGPHVRQVIPSAVRDVDPFVFLDHFGPIERKADGMGVPPHPHAGIATITYLFSGSNRHQDSYGHDATIQAGDMAWMQAGKGIVHAEGMNEGRTEPDTVHGLQFWISLPAKDKFTEPDFFFHRADELPVIGIGQTSIKVLCGTLMGYQSPVKSLSPAYIYELKAAAGEQIHIPINNGDTAGLYMVAGKISADGHELHPTVMTAFSTEGEHIHITVQEDSHFVLFGGTPLNEPIVAYASFVMNSEAQIQQVMNDYREGKMGQINH